MNELETLPSSREHEGDTSKTRTDTVIPVDIKEQFSRSMQKIAIEASTKKRLTKFLK
jgi:hypothetical protein